MPSPMNQMQTHMDTHAVTKYEIPTHLHVEDKLLGGLTVRQVLYVSVGLSIGYALWQHLQFFIYIGPVGGALRVVSAMFPVVVLLACGFAHPTGRPLEEWVLAAARYVALPKAAVWRSVTAEQGGADGEDRIARLDAGVMVGTSALAGPTESQDLALARDKGGEGDVQPRAMGASDHSPSATRLRFRCRTAAPSSVPAPPV